jgi:hypothetical protein
MKKLKDEDYLLRIIVRVAVRREDAAAVIALGDEWPNKQAKEEERVVRAVLDVIDSALGQHGELIEMEELGARGATDLEQYRSGSVVERMIQDGELEEEKESEQDTPRGD